MTEKEIFNQVLDYFKDNEDEFIDAIEELDNYNGYLGDDRYFSMDDLAENYISSCFSFNPYSNRNSYSEAKDQFENLMNRIYYGYDADSCTTDSSGEKTYGAFCPNRDFYTYNGYGNLISTDYKDYSDRLDEYFIESLYENRCNITLPDEVEELFDQLKSGNEEDDET